MKCPTYKVVYTLLFVCGGIAVGLQGITDGRSMAAFAVAGLVLIWAGVCSVLGRDSLHTEDEEQPPDTLTPPGPLRRLQRGREVLLPPGRAHRPRKKSKPMFDANFHRGTQGVMGVMLGIGFVAVGTLAALGLIEMR